ncbi:HNH endonuclease family protein [Photobacterium leiognathi lrivu.4.1]|uniref:HNH endonuclease family protein n=1 Tax=Photobacterium leiognathi lrivu.4.1 TaxID=1248232 RepID=A0A0U1P513_PHOLE|nr:HNH endonuclease signature motif containing protein [Photobacterium leiognathi]GAD29816.1 HNH endonuclease family protein [Photobacterium leiognathi lrivu.4.1]
MHKEQYDQLIKTGVGRWNTRKEAPCYVELHHIIPKCMGGGDDKSNLVFLTAEEHYEAHRLLAMAYPEERGLQNAWWSMCNRNGGVAVTPEEYSIARIRHSENMSGSNHPMYGRRGEGVGLYGRKGKDHPMYGRRGKDHPCSEANSGENNPMYGRRGKDCPASSYKGEKNHYYGITPWLTTSSKNSINSQKTWEMMTTIYRYWLDNEQPEYSTLAKKISLDLGVKIPSQLHNMVSWFKGYKDNIGGMGRLLSEHKTHFNFGSYHFPEHQMYEGGDNAN